MPEPLAPSTGLTVVHLFCHVGESTEREAIARAVAAAVDGGVQVVPVAILGAKADLAFLALGADAWALKSFQSALQEAGLQISESYVSVTELSEYAKGVPEAMANARLYPTLPPEGLRAWCFYPMSKRRGEAHNWYTLEYDEREKLMYGHGAIGRTFKGRVLQLVTGSAGLDDWEWGVTLFAAHLDDLKECVYTMRFDEASSLYAEFGPFYTGMVGTLDEVLTAAAL